MKNKFYIILALIFLYACKKNEFPKPAMSTLNVVNAIVNAGAVKVNYFGKAISWKNYSLGTSSVNFGAVQVYSVAPGNNIQIVQNLDTTKTLFNSVVANADKEIYSLFLTGTAAAPENIVIKESISIPYADESIGVRIVNLSPNSTPVNVTLASAPAVNEFTGVGYKQVTEFRKLTYPVAFVTGSNVFQFKDATGTLLATYTLPLTGALSVVSARRLNITVVIKGMQGTTTGTNAFGGFAMANY